jgi:hypothetical protein
MPDLMMLGPDTCNQQRGMARSGILFGLLLLTLLLALGVKLFPLYVDHNFVTSVARSILDSGNANTMSQTQIRQDLEASLQLNNIRDFDISNVEITRIGNNTQVRIQYEKRVVLIGNIDLVVRFDEVLN